MIPYIEVLDQYSLKKIAMIEPNEFWGELSFYDIGECELYCRATEYNLKYLKKGCFIKRPNNKYIWVITAIKYEFNTEGARMISATGFEAKWIIGKRAILKPVQLPNTLGGAFGALLHDNITDPVDSDRKINHFNYGVLDTTPISDNQATRGNLLEYMLTLGKTYSKGFQIVYENESLNFYILETTNKSKSVLFSQSMDNLIVSTYFTSNEDERTYALVVSKIEEIDYETPYLVSNMKNIDRAEIIVESNLSTKYTDQDGNEQEVSPTSSTYKLWQSEEGKKALAENKVIEEVSGELDMANSNYVFDEDYRLGDVVGVKDEYFGYSFNAKILKITFKQDVKGYTEEIEYGEGTLL